MSWKDELKAEIGDLMRSLDFDSVIINNINVHKRPSTDLKQLCALILELIDHIPEEHGEDAEDIEPWPENTVVVEGYSGFSGYEGINKDTEEPK